MGAGWLAVAVVAEEIAFAGAEEESQPGVSSGSAACLSVASRLNSAEDAKGTCGMRGLGGATSTVP